MTKKHLLLSSASLVSVLALYAFSIPNPVREKVWTIFFPEKNPNSRVVATEIPDAAPVSRLNKRAAISADTFEPLEERYDDFLNSSNNNPIDLRDPKAVESKVEYDPITGMYMVSEKIGDDYFRAPTYMTFDEYTHYRDKQQRQAYFDRLQGVSDGTKRQGALVDPISKFNVKTSLIDRLFGGTEVDIKPQGNINLTFGVNHQNVQNPILTRRQQKNTQFDFDMDINMSAQGKVGEKLDLNFNYNTQATFDFDNQMKIHYDPKAVSGSKDEILQNIEAGNVSLPLRSSLIKGAQNLFGIKTELLFGHLRTTIVASQQKSRQQNLTLQGGAQVQKFEVPIDDYDENRHFFISQWNRSQFEPALKCLPVAQSQFTITRMEVWVTNDGNRITNENTPVRQVVTLADLAEPSPFRTEFAGGVDPENLDFLNEPLPDNNNNLLYPRLRMADSTSRKASRVVSYLTNPFNDYGLKQIRDFEKVTARMLQPSEFSYNDQLGFISINLNVQPDQVVGVACEYTYNGLPHKIGEFSSDVIIGDTLDNNVLFLKMLKSTTANVKYPIWDLMMKNIYPVGAANVDPNEFRFDIYYEDPGKGQKRFLDANYIPAGLRSKPLIQLFNLDMLNLQGDPGPDGIFDFVPGLTINLRSGRIMFPVLEPFGKHLQKVIQAAADPGSPIDSVTLAKQILYTQLYDSTLFRAREFQQFNRFMLRGQYKSSSSAEISLGTFNLPPGSVKVSGGGRVLTEGKDYEIDYNIGKLRILDDAILQSGQNVSVSFEDNTLFGFNARTMIGVRMDYEFSKNLTVGGTFMNLFERPLTQKVNFGDDPINNKIFGADINYTKEAPWITRAIDRLPLIQTKAESSISAQAEGALLIPGYNRAINQDVDKGGTVYIDDFEGSTANVPLMFPANSWMIASVPQGDENSNNNDLFPENEAALDSLSDKVLALGANRARLSWYIADPSARDGAIDGGNPYTRLFQYRDIFPNRQISPLEQSTLRPLDVTIFPRERGPYNYDLPDGYTLASGQQVSKGVGSIGGRLELKEPATRWAGFMRGINNNDFEAANIEFLEFWMLNPYIDETNGAQAVSQSGDMYIDLGNVSEDVMRDSRQFFENSMPTTNGVGSITGTVLTPWGRVPVLNPLVNAFENDPERRKIQDVGLDGLNDEGEATVFASWLNSLAPLGQNIVNIAKADPSNDDFVHYRDVRFNADGTEPTPGLLVRYKRFNGQQGNTPEAGNNENFGSFVASATNLPDQEDLNRDNSLNENEAYFRYHIPLKRLTAGTGSSELNAQSLELRDFITDTINSNGAIWYRFKIPLDHKSREAVNGIQDFRSIRFARVFFKNFSEETTFRFATFELGRNQWRRFTQLVYNREGECKNNDIVTPTPTVSFDVNAVSLEENSARVPFNYTLPPGISRENSVGAFPEYLQNEQALSMNICALPNCEGRGVFKTLNMDLRQFERLKMFSHLEYVDNTDYTNRKPGEVSIFIRLGSDFQNNYYEYEIPMEPSDPFDPDLTKLNSEEDRYKRIVWRPENDFNLNLDSFRIVKQMRNDLGIIQNEIFALPDVSRPQNKYKVIGNPNLGLVKGAMIGIRSSGGADVPLLECVEVWVNEMRLTGFIDKKAYAGTARLDLKLADVANVSAAGTYTSAGWRGIDQKLLQTQLEDVRQYDVSATINLDKVLPEKWGFKIPFYVQRSEIMRRPLYDPYDLDIKLSDKIRNADSPEQADTIRARALDITTTQGYNFTNVRKERKGQARKLPMPWNIENFSVSYAKNRQDHRTPFIINDGLTQQKGGLDWQYATGIKPIYPLKKVIKNDKYLKFLTEFNFNPIPNTYGFNSNLERLQGVTVWRFAGEDPKNNTYYNRRFTWTRDYDLGWDLAKSLKFNFDASARSLIDEPQQFKPDGNSYTSLERRDSILSNVRTLGRPKGYTQNASLNWTVPLKTLPYMDFVNLKASYTTAYTWTAQSLKLQEMEVPDPSLRQFENSVDLGNVIQNNSVRQVNGDLDFVKFYNNSKYLAKINKPKAKGKNGKKAPGGGNAPGGADPGGAPGGGRGTDPGAPGGGRGTDPGGKGKGKGTDPAGGGGLSGGGLSGADKGKRDSKVPPDNTKPDNGAANPAGSAPGAISGAPGAPGMPGARPGQGGIGPDGKPLPGNADDKNAGKDAGKDSKGDKKDKDKKKEREPSMAERIALRPLMLVRKGRFTYSNTVGTVVPGFTPETKLMGLSEGFSAPGWGFVAGMQPNDQWLDDAATNGWITQRKELNQQVIRNNTQTLDGGLTIEPFTDFRIELSANRQYTHNNTQLFKDQNFDLSPDSVFFQHRAQRDIGSYSISYFALNTMFNNDIEGMYKRFEAYGPVFSKRLAEKAALEQNDPSLAALHENQKDNPGYYKGYGRIHQEVLIPAFVAAYTGSDPNTTNLNLFKSRPSVNWKLNYAGLPKVGNLSKYFASATITHGYKSNLTVNSFNTDIFYEANNPFKVDELNANYVARFEIPQVVISEQFQPLIGIDVKLKNDMTFKVDFKKSRILAMSFVDYNLNETRTTGYTVGYGYRMKNVDIPFLTGSNKGKKGSSAKAKAKKKKDAKTPPAPGPGGGANAAQSHDLTFKFDFDYRDDITVIHNLQRQEAQPSRGSRTIAIIPSVDYQLNRRLKLRLFADYRKTEPKTSQSFPITTLNSGITVQFQLN